MASRSSIMDPMIELISPLSRPDLAVRDVHRRFEQRLGWPANWLRRHAAGARRDHVGTSPACSWLAVRLGTVRTSSANSGVSDSDCDCLAELPIQLSRPSVGATTASLLVMRDLFASASRCVVAEDVFHLSLDFLS